MRFCILVSALALIATAGPDAWAQGRGQKRGVGRGVGRSARSFGRTSRSRGVRTSRSFGRTAPTRGVRSFGRTTPSRGVRSFGRTARSRSTFARRGTIGRTPTRSTFGRSTRGARVGSASGFRTVRPSSAARQGFTRRGTIDRASAARTRGFVGASRTRHGAVRHRSGFVGGGRHAGRGHHRHRSVHAVRHHGRHHHHHAFYRHKGFHLSFHFGVGPYYGCRYYYPYYHYASGRHYGFFYHQPVCYAYVPFGFYADTRPVYVTRYEYVAGTTPDYDVVEQEDAPAGDAGETIEAKPAADSPATERFLREATEAFKKADYADAADKFRLAALSAPDHPGALFAFGQALLALAKDEYAARVLKKAIVYSPALLKETGDISGVYRDAEEFDRVRTALEARAEAGGPAVFLLAMQRYFTGDPRCRDTLAKLAEAQPNDEAAKLLKDAAEKRFKTTDAELPPVR